MPAASTLSIISADSLRANMESPLRVPRIHPAPEWSGFSTKVNSPHPRCKYRNLGK